MHDLIETAPEPLALLRANGEVVYANRKMRSILDSSTEPLQRLLGVSGAAACVRHLTVGTGSWTFRVHPPGFSPQDVVVERRDAPEADPPFVLRVLRADVEGEADSILRRMVAHTPGAGQQFFNQLVIQLAAKLGVRWSYLGAVEGGDSLRTLAFCDGGTLAEGWLAPYADTPCEEVLLSGSARYPRDLDRLFPKMCGGYGRVAAFVGVSLVDASGEVCGVLSVMHDTPLEDVAQPTSLLQIFANRASAELIRYNAERAAERQRAFSEALLDQVGAFVVVLDKAGNITRINRAIQRDLGWDNLDLLGQPFASSLAEDDVWPSLHRVLAGEELAFHSGRWRAVHGFRHVQWNARRVDAPERGGRAVVVTAIDTTVLQQATEELDILRERLMEARRLEGIGRLAGGVAHDFNNLLMAIVGHADLIATDVDPESEAAHSVREIRQASDQAAQLTKQLLEFGRRQPLDRERVDLAELLVQVAEVLRPRLASNIELITPPVEPGIFILADRRRMSQVAVALSVNARDAMPAGGSLQISAFREDGGKQGPMAIIEVSDTGTGISADIMPHLFEPFFTTKELGRGTGLGLASSYGIVRQHGGSIEVDTRPGHGTTFRIRLPVAPDFVRAHPRRAKDGQEQRVGARVLLAEDDEGVRPVVARLLQSAGMHVVSAPDGEAAWAIFERDPQQFDVLMLDVVMPRLGGPGLAARARGLRPNIPIILTSGFVADPGALPADIRLLSKPYSFDELVRTMDESLSASDGR